MREERFELGNVCFSSSTKLVRCLTTMCPYFRFFPERNITTSERGLASVLTVFHPLRFIVNPREIKTMEPRWQVASEVLLSPSSFAHWHCAKHPIFLVKNNGNTKGKGLYSPETSICPLCLGWTERMHSRKKESCALLSHLDGERLAPGVHLVSEPVIWK